MIVFKTFQFLIKRIYGFNEHAINSYKSTLHNSYTFENIKSRANILTRVQSKAYTEPMYNIDRRCGVDIVDQIQYSSFKAALTAVVCMQDSFARARTRP